MENYKIYRKIIDGYFSQIYAAYDCKNKSKVVLKIVDIRLTNDHDLCVNDQIRILNKLMSYPNSCNYVVSYYTCFETIFENKKCMVLVFEHLIEMSLFDHIDYINKNELWKIIVGLISGINFIHFKGIAHRNISLYTVLYYDTVKFINFCLASDTCSEEPSVIRFRHQPPEMFYDNYAYSLKYAFASDMWAIGFIVYQLIKGSNKVPFKIENSDFSVLKKKNIRKNIKKGWIVNYPLCKNIEYLANRMLDANPDTRITAQEAYKFVKKIENKK